MESPESGVSSNLYPAAYTRAACAGAVGENAHRVGVGFLEARGLLPLYADLASGRTFTVLRQFQRNPFYRFTYNPKIWLRARAAMMR